MTSPFTDLNRPPLDERALRRALVVPGGEWSSLRVVAETGSTNTDLVAAAGELPHGAVLAAERQVAGRGRLGRTWSAPARSGLAVSVLVRPDGVPPERLAWLPLLAGVAARDALTRVGEIEVSLKWPNDLLDASGRKLGGILAERVATESSAVVIGMGVNVSLTEDELPVPQATSLALAGAATTDRDPVLRALLRELARRYRAWVDAGGDAVACGLHDAYTAGCATLGAEVRVELPGDRRIVGRAEAIAADGALLVAVAGSADGVERVAAGDVVHLRPAGSPEARPGHG
jgi:BirA family biotin operon repressor/biotin-[acetyl-CoA-carboxylase] ligase